MLEVGHAGLGAGRARGLAEAGLEEGEGEVGGEGGGHEGGGGGDGEGEAGGGEGGDDEEDHEAAYVGPHVEDPEGDVPPGGGEHDAYHCDLHHDGCVPEPHEDPAEDHPPEGPEVHPEGHHCAACEGGEEEEGGCVAESDAVDEEAEEVGCEDVGGVVGCVEEA
uniref:Uncharacterized protein n=1 Tax=Arcella intermedia TaxID=1963864 RepID=A0A6B2LKZ6_9EUKA